MIATIYRSDLYRYDYDSDSGIGWYTRLSDDMVSFHETGGIGREIKAKWERWRDNSYYSKCQKDLIFDNNAQDYLYRPRYEKAE